MLFMPNAIADILGRLTLRICTLHAQKISAFKCPSFHDKEVIKCEQSLKYKDFLGE